MNKLVIYLSIVSSASILIPFVIGLVRVQHAAARYLPIIILLSLGILNEAITYLLPVRNNLVNTNIYSLLEFPIYCWQFSRLNKGRVRKPVYFICIAVVASIWCIESFYFQNLASKKLNTVFIVTYSLLLVLFATNTLNRLIVTKRKNILTLPSGLLSLAILLYYGVNICVEIYYYFAPDNPVQNTVYLFSSGINICFNLIVANALLCIPRKTNFSPLLP